MSLCGRDEAERRREKRIARWERQIRKEPRWREVDTKTLRAEALTRMAAEDRRAAEDAR